MLHVPRQFSGPLSTQPCTFYFFVYIKVCNAEIHLLAGWFGSRLITLMTSNSNEDLLKIPLGKILAEPRPLKKRAGTVALYCLFPVLEGSCLCRKHAVRRLSRFCDRAPAAYEVESS